jgi:hypothetical protein
VEAEKNEVLDYCIGWLGVCLSDVQCKSMYKYEIAGLEY